jgi:hypothetical protein
MTSFMRSWEETYVAWLSGDPYLEKGKGSSGGRADQPAFRRCAWQHELKLFVLGPEYNFRLNYPSTVVDRVRVIHGRHGPGGDYETLAALINDRQKPRSWPRRTPLRGKIQTRLRKALPGRS